VPIGGQIAFEAAYTMKIKWTSIVVVALLLAMSLGSEAVNTRDIEKVRDKSVLDSEDLQIIDDFVAEAVRELAETKDFASISKTRLTILAYSHSKQSDQVQYSEQFSKSAYKYISSALEQAKQLTPEDHKFKVILNLLILIDGLEDLRLVDLALERLKDDNTAIRYWAVHCITNPAITEQLNSGKAADLQLAVRIVEQLKQLVETANPETLALMAEFAQRLDLPQGEDLLVQIADTRISQYADWTVDYELLDVTILKLLCEEIAPSEPGRPLAATSEDKSAVARRFGQLYSYAIQRYVKGRDFLDADQKQQLASVLVEMERTCISRALGRPQSVIKRAVEGDDYIGLLQEHSRLLGDETRPGQLASKLNFDYGRNPDGSKRIAPLTLPSPPERKVSE
jgi:hypothetical protein